VRRRSNAVAGLRPAPLRCSDREGGHTNSPSRGRDAAAQRRCARCSNSVWPTRRLRATRNPRSPALLGAAYVAADAHPPTALPAPPRSSSRNTTPRRASI